LEAWHSWSTRASTGQGWWTRHPMHQWRS